MVKISKVLAGICALLFVITGAMALLLFSIERKAFSSETYKQVFREQGLYQITPSLMANAISDSLDPSSLLSILDRGQLEAVISTLLPPQQMEVLTNDILDSVFEYINGRTDSVTVSLLPIKQNMSGDAGAQVFQQILSAQPPCTTEQILQIGLGLLSSSNEGLTLCNPPQELMGALAPTINSQFQSIALGIPDELTLITAEQIGADRDFRPTLNRIRLFMVLSPILPLIFLSALTLLAVRSLDEWLHWWGIPFMILGMLGILLAITGTPIIRWMVNAFISQGASQIPDMILSLLSGMVGSLARQILNPILTAGSIILLFGAGMFGTAILLKRKR